MFEELICHCSELQCKLCLDLRNLISWSKAQDNKIEGAWTINVAGLDTKKMRVDSIFGEESMWTFELAPEEGINVKTAMFLWKMLSNKP